ncbi:MAG: hypothetical protein HFJ50_06490 [Clostridia bacterium]|jgi:septal ring factor EnvC (AmiA/AmiB activator)|nr:hypothetical protein [Clostridia bacterium]
MNYINRLEIENKGLEVINGELKKEINDLKIYLAMAQGARDLNEKMLFTEQKEKKELQHKLNETEKQVELLKKTINRLTKENEKLKKEVEQSNQQNTIENADLQDLIVNGLNFLTKAMAFNQNSIQKI